MAQAKTPSPGVKTTAEDSETIVVTGSRVIQNGNNMPTPVTVVTTQQLLQAGPPNVIDAVQELPVFAGNTGPQNAGGRPTDNNAGHTLNIRNLGPTRALILFDGQRIAPTSQTGTVNVDFIPSLLLQRVDVVTGGASAVYGSDAVAGVVNFITDRHFNGYKLDANAGISSRGDGAIQQIGIAAGGNLGSRLHIEGSYQFYNMAGIINSRSDRAVPRAAYVLTGAGTAANPYTLTANGRINNLQDPGGLIGSGPLAGMIFKQNGVLSPFVHGAATGTRSIEVGGDGFYFDQYALQGALRTHQLFGRADYDVSDDVHAYVEGVGSIQRTRTSFAYEFISAGGAQISNSNPFLPASVRAQLPPGGSFTLYKTWAQNPVTDDNGKVKTYLINGGVDGQLGGWKWNVSGLINRNQQTVFTDHNWTYPKVYAGLDSVVDPASGNIVCHVTLTNPGLYPDCQPINPFGPTATSAAALKYIELPITYTAVTKLKEVTGSIAGSPFDTWAGPLQVALSGEYRTLSTNVVSNHQPSDFADCTGLTVLGNGTRGSCTATTTVVGTASVASSHGGQSVGEVAVEAEAPLLKDLPFAESASINGAARYTHYNTNGTVWSWKVGINWSIDKQLTLRAVRSRDIRAPNLNELFAPSAFSIPLASDVHTGTPVQLSRLITSGNPNLNPEIADTWTAGIVLRPNFFPNFSLAVDYYRISIGNAIVLQNGTNVTTQNACEATNGTSPLCDLIIRPLPFSDHSPANLPTLYLAQPVNTQKIKTQGIDLDAGYQAPLLGGNLNLRTLLTYQPHLYQTAFGGAPRLDLADVPPVAKYRILLLAGYEWNGIALNLRELYRSSFTYNADRTLVYKGVRIPSFYTTDATLSYKLRSKSEFYISIQNLFDRQAPAYAAPNLLPGLGSGTTPGDDVIGRYFTAGVRIRL